MKAGKTDFEVGDLVVIVESNDPDMFGLVGNITHPFPGLMVEGYEEEYIAGLYLVEPGIFRDDICNLTVNDVVQKAY